MVHTFQFRIKVVETDDVLYTYLIIMLIPAYRIWIHEIFSSFLYPWGTARSIWIMFTPPVVTYNQATNFFACTNDFKHESYNIELFAFNIVTLIWDISSFTIVLFPFMNNSINIVVYIMWLTKLCINMKYKDKKKLKLHVHKYVMLTTPLISIKTCMYLFTFNQELCNSLHFIFSLHNKNTNTIQYILHIYIFYQSEHYCLAITNLFQLAFLQCK